MSEPEKTPTSQNSPAETSASNVDPADTSDQQAKQNPTPSFPKFSSALPGGASIQGALGSPGTPVAMQMPLGFPLAAQMQQTVVWQGQYPPPDAVERYEKTLPGSFDRIISMAERLQAAQIEEARRAQEFMRNDTRRGHYLGFSAIVLAFLGAFISMLLKYPWVAGACLSVSVMGVAKALIDSARQPKQMEEKTPPPPAPLAPPAGDRLGV